MNCIRGEDCFRCQAGWGAERDNFGKTLSCSFGGVVANEVKLLNQVRYVAPEDAGYGRSGVRGFPRFQQLQRWW